MHDLRLGIDVGGTNIDAVVLDAHGHVLAKTPTTVDVMSGIARAIDQVLSSGIPAQAISSAMLGTTQCINAILQREQLGRVGVVRLGAPATLAIPPLSDWPQYLRSHIARASGCVAKIFKLIKKESILQVLPWDMGDNSTNPFQALFGLIFGHESVQTGLLFPDLAFI